MNKDELKVGLQVAYIPPYVHDRNKTTQDALKDVDTEFGFVTSWNEDAVFVRYWIKRWPGELRNVANAEGCDYDLLYKCGAVPQYIVDDLIDAMRANPKYYGWYREGQWDLKERNDD